MRVSLLPAVIFFGFILPVISSSLLPRSDVCANDGKTKVGTLFHGRDLSLSALQPRAVPHIPCFWCLPRTQTALAIKTFTPNFWVAADSSALLAFFSEVLTEVRKHLSTNSDLPIPGGEFFYRVDGLHWFVMNSNNHQVTWGVMGAAVEALANFMVLYGFGPAEFMIMDGMNIVARGLFRQAP